MHANRSAIRTLLATCALASFLAVPAMAHAGGGLPIKDKPPVVDPIPELDIAIPDEPDGPKGPDDIAIPEDDGPIGPDDLANPEGGGGPNGPDDLAQPDGNGPGVDGPGNLAQPQGGPVGEPEDSPEGDAAAGTGPTGGAAAAPGQGGGVQPSGELPVTGVATWLVGGVGTLLLMLGAASFGLARRATQR